MNGLGRVRRLLGLGTGNTRPAPLGPGGGGEEQDFGIFVVDDGGQILASAYGTIGAGCCQMHTAVGRRCAPRSWAAAQALMGEAEDEAR